MPNQKGNKHITIVFTKIRCHSYNNRIIVARFGSCSFFVSTRVKLTYVGLVHYSKIIDENDYSGNQPVITAYNVPELYVTPLFCNFKRE